MTDIRLNQIKIKTGILKRFGFCWQSSRMTLSEFRVTKEKFVCEKEVETEKKRLEMMKSQNRDEYDLRKQVWTQKKTTNYYCYWS